MGKFYKNPEDFNNFEMDYVRRVRKQSREDEIGMHGKNISMRPAKVKESKKKYKRQDKYSYNMED